MKTRKWDQKDDLDGVTKNNSTTAPTDITWAGSGSAFRRPPTKEFVSNG